MTMMHQYGAGGQDMLLMSDPRAGAGGIDNGGDVRPTRR